jgi:hypothetical protein
VGACVSPTPGAFHAVSFVNGVATPRGGNHVHHVSTPLLSELRTALAKRLKLSDEQQVVTLTLTLTPPLTLSPTLTLTLTRTLASPSASSSPTSRT